MDATEILRILAVDPSRLDPSPQWSPWAGSDRIGLDGTPPKPCVACGAPAVATRVLDTPGHGRRWIDRCHVHFLATAQRSTGESLDNILAALADAARVAGIEKLDIITDQ